MNEVNALFETVLLVEDDAAHVLLVKRALKGLVGEVRSVASVQEGLEMLTQWVPELIISDLNLPDSKGLQHVEKLKAQVQDVPIIVLTSSNSIHDAVKAMQLGAKDFLVKNFDNSFPEILGLSLSRLCANMLVEEERLRLERETAALRRAIESSHDGMAVVSRDGTVRYSNTWYKRVVELCGGGSEDLFSAFSPAVKEAGQLNKQLKEKLVELSSGGVWSTEISLLNNKDIAFGLSLSILDQPGAKEVKVREHAVVWIRDISEQKRRERFQREILSATTHDLKGPLGTISLCAEMLQEVVKGKGKAEELTLRVASSSRGALNLIDEFLSARRIQEGTFILKPTEVELNEAVRAAVEDYAAMAKAKQQSLTFNLLEQPLSVKVDRLGLSRVLGNLLSNAIKFTPKNGKICVTVKASPSEYRIEVQDTGTGMEPGAVHKIFERYSRLSEHGSIEGSGIGLFVVKSIVSAHSGAVEVASKVGQGTTFTVILPIAPPVNERGEVMSLDFK